MEADGTSRYKRGKVMLNTLFFVLGISFAFLLLGLGFTAAGQFFGDNRLLFSRIGGVLVILFGLYQLGVFGSSKVLGQDHRLPFHLDKFAMSPLVALLLGFTFSFAWTPCVGPALTSVLVMAGSSASRTQGFLLIGVYTLGFVLPFLAVGLFTSQVLSFFRRHTSWLKYTAKAGGVLLILMGVMMFTGWMNSFTGYLSGVGTSSAAASSSQAVSSSQPDSQAESQPESQPQASSTPAESEASSQPESAASSPEEEEYPVVAAPDFTLVDQYGNEHTLSDYKGKTVFLNFWATWCGPCKQEMPDIQQLYLDHGENTGDVIILGVAAPKSEDNPFNQETLDADGIADFLEEGGYTYPVLMDTTGDVLMNYGISAFPTTFMIDSDGNLFGYLQGSMTREIMDSIIDQTVTGIRAN